MEIMPNMSASYPQEIFPKFTYKRRLNVDKLLASHPDLLVVRMVDGDIGQYQSITQGGEQVLTDKVFKNSMANLSMNLAGGLFDVSVDVHLCYLPEKSVVKPWQGWPIKKSLCSKESSYKRYGECFGLSFCVRKIHNRTFPFYKHFDTQKDRDDYAREVAAAPTNANVFGEDAKCVDVFKSKKENVLVHPRIRMHHAPTNANYWHVTLDTYRPTEVNYIRSEEVKSADKKMFKALKQDLLVCCTINESPCYKLEKSEYYKRLFYYLDAFCMKVRRKAV